MRSTWTDERLDDGFDRVSADITQLRRETAELRRETAELRKEIAEVRREIADLRVELHTEIGALRQEINARFDGLQRTMLQVGGGIAAALLGILATQL